jgi:hypothetical protein
MTIQAKMICPTCGTLYGVGGCPHTPSGGSSPPGSIKVPVVTPAGGTRTVAAATPKAASPGLYVGAQVVPQGDFKISSLGFERSGKTTYIGMLYFLVTTGRLPGYRFAWSDSLRDLEAIRAQLHRPATQGGPTFPPRTETEKTLFMHLGLRRWDDDRFVDLYFPEFSGEDVARIAQDGAFPKNLHFLEYFDGYLIFIDATATSPMDIMRYSSLVTGLCELKKQRRLSEPVAVLLSKWDLVVGQDDVVTPEEFFRDRFGGLYESFRGQLEEFRVFPVSSVGKVRTLQGHDGLPIKKDGAVMHVPAPERVVVAEDQEPLFTYKPLNLSRPLLWLLDQLAGRERKR